MSELQLARAATKWLRSIGLAAVALLVAVAFSLASFLNAQSSADGSDSEIDYALEVSSTKYATGAASLAFGSQVTWEAWIKPSSSQPSGYDATFFGKEYSFLFSIYNNEVRYHAGNGSSWQGSWTATGVKVTPGTWNHLAFVMNGSSLTLYLNGQEAKAGLTFTGGNIASNLSYPVFIGKRGSEYLNGEVDEARIWTTTRTAAQIQEFMHKKLAGNEANLQAYWDFNEPSGSTVYDRTGSYNLSIAGTAVRKDIKAVSSVAGETVITFPRTYLPGVGGWTVPTNIVNARALVVAGGGGGDRGIGGVFWGHGGGGGEVLEQSLVLMGGSTVSAIVGQGAIGNEGAFYTRGGSGQGSTFAEFSARGGGSSLNTYDSAGARGGSSGNGNLGGSNGVASSPCTVTNNYCEAGAGGGAGGAATRMNGGPGISSSISGTILDYGAGGAGRNDSGYGTASDSGATKVGTTIRAAPANRGGGGTDYAARGGSGVVIVRYAPSIDQSITLTGAASSYLSGPAQLINTTEFTVEAWVNYSGANTGTWRTIFAQYLSDTDRIYLGLDTSNQLVYTWGGSNYVSLPTSSFTMPQNEWTHFALVRSSTGAPSLYVNGSLISSSTNASTTKPNAVFTVGSSGGGTLLWPGDLDQVKVWSSALNAVEVAKSMHSYGATASDGVAVAAGKTLKALFDFNEFQPGQEFDRTGNGNHLTAQSAISVTSYTSSKIVETGTAYGAQTYVQFKRSYLTAVGGWKPPSGVRDIKALVVAGGGGGGAWVGGGGGAGGLTYSSVVSNAGFLPIQVGQGGRGGVRTSTTIVGGTSGQESKVGNFLSALGGGRGGSHTGGTVTSEAYPTTGGSGGGGTGYSHYGGARLGYAGTVGQGNAGGTGYLSAYNAGGGGGAGSAGLNAGSSSGGAGGSGLANSITGTSVTYAGGGGGSRFEYSAGQGLGGSGGGGNAGYPTGSGGEANSGGGGGGGASATSTTASTGGSGGSGVVILSYGPYLEVTASPTLARAGTAFSTSIAVQLTELDGSLFSTTSPVTVTASAGVLTLNGEVLTQSYTVNAVNGIATFTGLGFATSVAGAQTLTFTSDAFVGTTLTVTPSYYPGAVEIKSSGTTGGSFANGEFFASTSSGTTVILASDLTNHMQSFSTVISASGSIKVVNGFTSTSSYNLTLKTQLYIEVAASQQVKTYGGDIILWSDSDNFSGGYIRLLSAATLCTTASTCSTTETGGGDIVLGGGLPDASDPSRPGGTAKGSGSVWSSFADSTGVQLGTLTLDGAGAKLYSAGGQISVKGQMSGSLAGTNAWGAGVAIVGSSVINSGQGKIYVFGETTNGGGTGSDGPIEIGAWGGSVSILSRSTASDAVVFEAKMNNVSSTKFGIWGANNNSTITSSGGLVLRSNYINSDLDLDLDVSGKLVIEGFDQSLRDGESSTVFAAGFGSADNKLTLLRNPSAIQLGNSSNSNEVELGTSFTADGPIDVYAGKIDVLNNIAIQSASESAHILLKAKDWIDIRVGTNATSRNSLQTNNGDIVLWADSDGNSSGSIYLGSYAELNSANGDKSKTRSGGGRITLAGGDSGADADGHPLGYAADTGFNNTSAANYAMVLTGTTAIYSGGGDVTLRARSDNNNADAAHIYTGHKTWAGTGEILLDFIHTGSSAGARLEGEWISSAASSPAISISASRGSSAPAISNADGSRLTLASTDTSGGGISISASVASETTNGIEWNEVDLLSAAGSIRVTTNGQLDWSDAQARSIGAMASSDVLSSAASVQITTQAYKDSTDNTSSKISTSGSVQINPYASNFNADSEIEFSVEADSFTFGSLANVDSATNGVKVSRDVSTGGQITLAGNSVTLGGGADLVTANFGVPITLKAKGWIDIVSNQSSTLAQTDDSDFSTIQTNHGDITLWSDSDANQEGLIWIGHNARLNSDNGVYSYEAVSGGGDIYLAGGNADGSGKPSSFAWDKGSYGETSSTDFGVGVGAHADLFTGGGDLVLRAAKKNAGGLAAFIFRSKGEFITGTGRLVIDAQSSVAVEAMEFYTENEAGALFSSHSTAQPAISISASISGTSTQALRLYNQNSANPTTIQSLASTGGGISIASTLGSTSTNVGSYLAAVNFLSTNGEIAFTSNASMSITNEAYVQHWGAKADSSVSNSVADVNWRVNVLTGNANTATVSTSGDVSIQPFGSTFGDAMYLWQDVNGAASFTLGSDSLISTATYVVYPRSTININGPVEMYGKSFSWANNEDLKTSGQGSKILLKARDDIYVPDGSGTVDASHTYFQTNKGDIVLWSDADGSGAGGIVFGNYVQLTSDGGAKSKLAVSGGGDIVLGGGTASDADGHPTGYTGLTALGFTDRAAQIGRYNGIYTGGGDFSLKARSSSTYGLTQYHSSEFFTGTGVATFDAVSTNTGGSYGFAFIDAGGWANEDGPLTIVSHSSRSPAISITGSTAGTAQAVRLYGQGGANTLTLASTATEGGGIQISGQAASAGDIDVHLYRNQILSRNGAITISAGVNKLTLDYGFAASATMGSNALSNYVTTSSANISFIADEWDFDDPGTVINTTGDVSILPKTNNFFGSNATFGINTNGIRNLTIGKDPLSQDTLREISITGNHTVSGNVRVYGGYVYPKGNFSATGVGEILFKALSDIRTDDAARNFTTQGGDITFWADSNATSGGLIYVPGSSKFSSNGGDITLAGGLDDGASDVLGARVSGDGRPDGYAVGRSGEIYNSGIMFAAASAQRSPSLLSGGGDIYLAGKSSNVSNASRTGLFIVSGVIDAGSGQVRMRGTLDSSSDSSYQRALLFGYGGSDISVLSSNGAADAIQIHGDASGATGGYCVGIQSYDNQNLLVANEGSGGVHLIGDGCASDSTDNYTYTDGIALSDTSVLARSGLIRLEGTTRNSTTAASGVYLNRRNQSGDNGVFIGANNRTYSLSTGKSVVISTSSSNVEFLVNSINGNSTPISTSGTVTIKSRTGYAFSHSPVLTNIELANSVTGFEIGHSGVGSTQNTVDVTLNKAYSISGQISVYAQNISVTADQHITSAVGGILLKASGRISTGTSVDLRTNGGDVVLWADSDENGAGSIYLEASNTMCSKWVSSTCQSSGGGDIYLAGGAADADGNPQGNAKGFGTTGTSSAGVSVGTCAGSTSNNDSVSLNSAGGAMHIRGSGTAQATGTGIIPTGVVLCGGTQLTLGSGKLVIDSEFRGTGSTYAWAFMSAPGGVTAPQISSSNSEDDAVLISAYGSIEDYVSNGLNYTNTNGGGMVLAIDSQFSGSSRKFNFSSSGQLTIRPNGSSFKEEIQLASTIENISTAASGVTVGSATNTASILVGSNYAIAGDYLFQTSSFINTGSIKSTGSGSKIEIASDLVSVSAELVATNSGSIELRPKTANREIAIGSSVSGKLSIDSSTASLLKTSTLRIGSMQSGDIELVANTNFANADSVTLRTAGDVSGVNGAVLTAQNLAIDAGGNVDLPGGQAVIGNVAISASSSVTYRSAVSYSPAVVDGVLAVFGIGIAVSQTNSPTAEEANEFLAVTFNPPPQFVVTDSYSNTLDSNNRLAASYTVSATVTQGSGSVVGLSANFSAGVYSFNSLRVDTDPGTYSFTITVDDGASGFTTTSSEYSVLAGEPASLVVTETDISTAAGKPELSYSIAFVDSTGNNIVSGPNSGITVSATVLGATLVSGGSVTASAGVATFNDLVVSGSVSEAVSISFSVGFTNSNNVFTVVSSATSSLTITPGDASALAIDVSSQTAANRSTISAVVVSLLDAYGNTLLNRTDTVSVTASSGSPVILGTQSVDFQGGASTLATATFDNISLQASISDYVLSFSANIAGVTTVSHAVTLTHGAADQLVLVSEGAGARAGIALSNQPSLAVLDADGNLVTSGSFASAVITATSSAELGGTETLTLSGGEGTFANLALLGTAGSKSLAFQVTSPAGYSAISTSQTIELGFGAAFKLSVKTQPSDAVAGVGQSSNVVVEVQDSYSNPVVLTQQISVTPKLVAATGLSHISTSAAVTLAAGDSTGTFSPLAFTTAGTQKLLFESSGLEAAYSSQFVISAAGPHHLGFVTNTPTTVTNNLAFSPAPTLRVFDEFNNPVITTTTQTQVSVSMVASSSDVATISGGVVTTDASSSLVSFDSLKLEAKVGSYQLRFTAIHAGAAIDGFTIDSDAFELGYGAAVGLTVSPSAVTVANRETLPDIDVSVIDSYGNTVGDSSANISFASFGPSLIAGSNSTFASSGVATFSGLEFSGVADDYTLSFTSNALSAADLSLTIGHGEATEIRLTAPANIKNNSSISSTALVAKIFDFNGNLVTTGDQSAQTVTLTAGSGALSGDTAISASGGIATFSNVALTGTAGANSLSVAVSLPSALSTFSNVTLLVGDPYRLELSQSAAGANNREVFAQVPEITVQDISGNTVPATGMDIRVRSLDAALAGTITASAATGVANFASDLVLTGTAGNQTLVFEAEGTGSSGVISTSQTIVLNHGEATQVVLTSNASGARSNKTFTSQPTLEIRDADGNRVSTSATASAAITAIYSGDTLAQGGADLLGTKTVNATAGVATFSNLSLQGISASYSISFQVGSSALSVSQNIDLISGDANALRFIQQPSDFVAGQNMSPGVSAEIIDTEGNRVLDATDAVSVAWEYEGNGGSYGLTPGFAPSQGFLDLSSLTFYKAHVFKLRLQASGLESATSNMFEVQHAAADSLAWVSEPSGSYSNDFVISPAPKLQVLDAYSNAVSTGPVITITPSVTGSNQADLEVRGGSASTAGDEFVSFTNMSLHGLIGNYTLEFTANDGSSDFAIIQTSQPIEVVAGLPTQLALTTPAAGSKAGLAFSQSPVVEIRDSAGNLVTTSNLEVSVRASTQNLIGATSVSAVSGVANLPSDLGLAGVATDGITLTYTATYSGVAMTVSQLIDLKAGNPHHLTVLQDATDVQTRIAFSPEPSVEIRDAYENIVLSDSTSEVTVALYRGGVEKASESEGVTASNGVVTFTGLSYQITPLSGYYLRFNLASISAVVTSSEFVVLPGPVAAVEIITQPSSLESDSTNTRVGNALATQPWVKLVDQDGNTVTTLNSGVVTAAISSGTGGSVISASANIVQGKALFTELAMLGSVAQPGVSAQDYKLEFNYSSFSSVESDVLNLRHGLPSKVVIVTPASGGQSDQGFAVSPVVKVLDAYDNLAYTEATQPTIRIDGFDESDNSSVTPSQNTRQMTAGVATLTPSIAGLVTKSYRFEYVVVGNSSITKAVQTGITLTPGVAHHLTITRQPLASVSGTISKTGQALLQQPVIEMRDNTQNLVTSWTGTIRAELVNTNPNRDAGRDYLTSITVSAVSGVATFSDLALIGEPGFDYQIRFVDANDSAITPDEADEPIAVVHADAEYLTIQTQPEGANKTGSSLSVSPVIAVRDFDGNITTSLVDATISAAISIGNGSVVANGLADVLNGIATFQNLTLVALPGEAQQLVFTLDTFVNSASGAVVSTLSNEITLTPADPSQLHVSTQPSGSVVAGELFAQGPVVEVWDRFGNLVPDFVGLIHADVSGAGYLVDEEDQALDSVSAVVSGGYATFNTLRMLGSTATAHNLVFTATGLSDTTSGQISVLATSPASLSVFQQPIGGITGDVLSQQPVIKILDRFGNLVESDNSTQVTVSVASGPSRVGGGSGIVSGSLTVTAVSGLVTFSSLEFTGLVDQNYTLGFTDGVRSVTSGNFFVSAASAQSLQWVTQPSAGKTGDEMSTDPVLRLLDFDENLAVSTSATVAVSVVSGGGRIESGTTSSIVDGGIISFPDLVLVAPIGVEQVLRFTATTADGSFFIDTTETITVSHADPSQLVLVTDYPQLSEQGFVLGTQPAFEIHDRYGNKATSDNSTVVTASIGSGIGAAISGSATATAVAGDVVFAGLAITGSPSVSYTIDFAADHSGIQFGFTGTTIIKLYKTASIDLSYDTVVYSSSPTVMPAIAVTDSIENNLTFSTSTAQFCTVNSSTGEATIVGAGTCVIRAEVADGTYFKANAKTVNLVITKATQSPLVISSNATSSGSYKVIPYGEVLTLGSSGGTTNAPIEYSVSGTDCRILGTTIMLGEAKQLAPATYSCRVRAYMAGNDNYEEVAATPLDVFVVQTEQAPLAIANSREIQIGDVALFTYGGSGTGEVSYTATTGTAGCSVDGSTLSATANGTCEVFATKAASRNFEPRISPAIVFTFSKQVQQVSFTTAVPSRLVAGQAYSAQATASSGLSVSYAITLGAANPPTAAVCELSQTVSGQVLFRGSGICEITATQAGSPIYASASASQRFEIGKENQNITFGAISDRVFGSPVFALNAVASSGLPVSYTISDAVTACSIADGKVQLLAAGLCEITATQAGSAAFAAAPNITRAFMVTPDLAGSPALVSAAVGNQWFTVGFNAPSYLGGTTVLKYRLEVTDVDTGDKYVNNGCSTVAPLTCTVTGIPNGLSYTAKVAAITSAGIGRYSNATSAMIPSRAAMSVTQLSAEVASSGLDLSWTPPVALDGNFQSYEVYVWVTGSQEPQTASMIVNSQAASSISVAVSSISNLDPDLEVAPAYFEAPRLNIIRPLYRPNQLYVFGQIQHAPVGFFTLASNTSPATESATVGYTMKVVTITDVSSTSVEINTANGVKIGLTAPMEPTQLTLDTLDPAKILVSWAAPNSDGGFAVEDYDVVVNGQTKCANLQVMYCEITPLAAGTTYTIEVMARNALGLGTAAVGTYTTPAPPTVISETSNGGLGGSGSVGGSTSSSPEVPDAQTPPVTTKPTPKPTVTKKPAPTTTATPKPAPKPVDPNDVEDGSNDKDTDPVGTGEEEKPPVKPGDITDPETNAIDEGTDAPGVFDAAIDGPLGDVAEAIAGIIGGIADAIGIDFGQPKANAGIGASGDDSVIEPFDPLGSKEAIKATNGILAAAGALLAVAGAVAAAAGAAAAAAGAAAAGAASAGAAGSAASGGAQMSEDSLDALAEADFDIDVFDGTRSGAGDRLALYGLGLMTVLDSITRRSTRKTARFSPLLAKLINDGIYLRAIFGPLSVIPMALGVLLAVTSLNLNAGMLIHPPVILFMAIMALGIFDAFAGTLAVFIFVLGSLPLMDFSQPSDWRMLAGIVVAGFGPIVLARSIRNFRRISGRGIDGLITRIADIAFAALMGGWIAGLVVRALPALTGLTLPAANYVSSFQLIGTVAIALRILLEAFAARFFPARMDKLAPDSLPEPPKIQVVIVQILRYFFYVFIASAFMGFGPIVFIASALFMLPTVIGYFQDKLPVVPVIWRYLPKGLAGLAMMLGLEIVLENVLGTFFGDNENFSTIFVFGLLGLILLISTLGILGREGKPGEERFFLKPEWRWPYRIFGFVVFLLLMQFTGML